LHLSCPEAARLVLSGPESMNLIERVEEQEPERSGSVTSIASELGADMPHRVRALVIEAIRERSLPMWQRIVSLGFALESLASVEAKQATAVMEEHLRVMREGLFQKVMAEWKPDPAFQLEIVLDLVVARLGSDYTAPRFKECFGDFMNGLAWTAESTMEELGVRYSEAASRHFLPFIGRHEHLLENYLVNYIFRTMFPYRRKLANQTFAMDSGLESMRNAWLVLSIHYAIIRTLLTGMAARYQGEMSMTHAIKLVQSYSKAFLHDTAFETNAIAYMEKNVKDPGSAVGVLVMDCAVASGVPQEQPKLRFRTANA
jgi:lysine-N-methylase